MASHTTKNAKQPAADKPLTIEEIRTQDGFLPQYSDYYFEKQTTVEFLILFGLGILCATSFSFSLAYDYENTLWNILLPLSVILTVFSIVFLKWGRKEQKTSGFYLEPTEIRKETFFSIQDNIS